MDNGASRGCTLGLLLCLGLTLSPGLAGAFEPTTSYERRQVEGFTVRISRQVREHPAEAEAALQELERQLKQINRVLPADALAALRKVPIWMEWEAKKNGAAEFHPSGQWLREHGYNPDKTEAVEINNARNFVAWSRRDQPCMLLHELAHAYHRRVLGFDHAGVEAAYRQAVDRKRYESVRHVSGSDRRHYALTDPKEYFAELSEAYFGKNDFYPFTRPELETHDPAGFRLMRQTWYR